MSGSAELDHAIYPVTALRFLQTKSSELLLAGEGPFLRIYNVQTCSIIRSVKLFPSNPVQGIKSRVCLRLREDCATALVWAGRSICVVEFKCNRLNGQLSIDVKIDIEGCADDRILDACFSNHVIGDHYNSPSIQAILVTSHNVLLSLQLSGKGQKAPRLADIRCLTSGPRTLLCSADLTYSHNGSGLVAAGTAFGDVFLWSFYVDPLQIPASSTISSQMHHTFGGHEGSVFGVSLSELQLAEPPVENRFMASCGDDRSIRFHNVTDIIRNASDQRGQNISVGPEQSSTPEISMGHSSRIWGVRFLGHAGQSWYVLSYGEDSTARIWRLSKASPAEFWSGAAPFRLEHLSTYKYHFGKNLWAVAVSEQADSKLQIASGGADGRIVTYELGNHEQPLCNNDWRKQYSVDDIQQHLVLNAEPAAPDISPLMRMFTSLKGEWTLERDLHSAIPTYPSGTLKGTANFEDRPPSNQAYDMEYLYTEVGELTTHQGFRLAASRQYAYRYQESKDQISAWFVKPEDGSSVDYLFHTLRFGQLPDDHPTSILLANGYHLCVEDNYSAEYKFELNGARNQVWSLKYTVKGPNKDYVAESRYSREISNGTPSKELSTKSQLDTALAATGTDSKYTEAESLKTYAWINEENFLATTDHGWVLLGSLTLKQTPPGSPQSLSLSWSKIVELPELKGTSIITVAEKTDTAVLTGSNGTIFLYKHRTRTVAKITELPRKVACMQASQLRDCPSVRVQGKQSVELFIFVSFVGTSTAHCLLVQLDGEALRTRKVNLDLPTSFVATTSRCIEWEGLVSLGSRGGDIAIYSIDVSEVVKPQAARRLSVHRVHGSDAVTTIIAVFVPSYSPDSNICHILTTGRNGTYAIHRLTKSESSKQSLNIDFSTLHVGALPFGPHVEGGIFHHTGKELILWGFRGKEFVVWNETRKMETMNVECGGSNRNWAYIPRSDNSDGGNFIWTKASLFNISIQPQASHRLMQFGGHGREIKAVAISPAIVDESGVHHRFLASGAEDTTIRIFDLPDDRSNFGDNFQCLHILPKHTTGIRKLRWSPNGHFLFSAAGREELFIWRVHYVPYFGIGIVCDSAYPKATESADLRIMDFDMLWKNAESPLETYIFFAVYSDSSIRIFTYECNTRSWVLVSRGQYTSYCLTQTKVLRLNDLPCLCTTSTDGYISFWPLSVGVDAHTSTQKAHDHSQHWITSLGKITIQDVLTWASRYRVHQNSIQCMATVCISDADTILATAGDDGSIAFSRTGTAHVEDQKSSSDVSISLSTLVIPKAHASAATALRFLNVEYSDLQRKYDFISSGNDQRLQIWQVDVDLGRPGVEGFSVRRRYNSSTTIADLAYIELIAANQLILAGIGMEVRSFT
ncbi:MAG: hypothetical protein Q9191_001985 [Dirinaria sp. TL-2023a]